MKIYFLLILALLPLVSCIEENQNKEDKSQLKFNIDSSIISSQIDNPEIGIKYSYPKNQNEMPDSLLKVVANSISLKNEQITSIEPLKIYANQAEQSILFISKVKFNKENPTLQDIQKIFQNIFKTNFPESKLKSDVIKINNLDVLQLLITAPQGINFKLLTLNDKKDIIQFDYIYSNDNYQNKIKEIESSIGSVNK